MIRLNLIVSLIIFSLSMNLPAQIKPPVYPGTQKVDQVDDYFGTKVADPYRWLEDDNSPETEAWVNAQNMITQEYLSKITFRNKIRDRLTELWDFPKMEVPEKGGVRLFFLYNTGMQNQHALYMQEAFEQPKELLYDPNKVAPDGSISINQFKASDDGKYIAISISRSGSDWQEIIVMDLKKKKLLKDKIEWVKFSGISWKDNGFYYSRYDAPKEGTALTKKNEFHKIYYHKAGTSQEKDELVYQNPDFPLRNYTATVSDDKRFLFIYETESTSGNALYYKDLLKGHAGFQPLFTGFSNDYAVVGNYGDSILIHTNAGASNYRLISINPEIPGKEGWTILIDEDEKMVMESVRLSYDKIVVKYMKNACNELYLFDKQGKKTGTIELPMIGTVGDISSRPGDPQLFYAFTSFVYPLGIFLQDFEKDYNKTIFFAPVLFQPDDFETKQVFYKSNDGTEIPMFIIHKKGMVMNGLNPAYLYGYGGFNISLTPSFSVSRMIFAENGGILAIPNIRGGGEFGEAWHKAGTKEKKQQVFDDFIAAANYLFENKYTKPEKLAIAGGSNGGLLVGACMTQKPELFKVALPAVGVLDMLRFHKFTIGWAWTVDYGSSEDKEGFTYLYKYSPLHNIKDGVNYPATLVTTADHDDRVVPAHSFKFIATLQEKHKGNNPVLIRIQTKAGHGAGKPTSVRIEEAADMWAFTFYNLGMVPGVDPQRGDPMEIKKQRKPAYIDDPVYKKNLPKQQKTNQAQPE
ncbi:MAG TPA: prolyl oligopeptidase family serine peptidase [Bacteroidales bacterium]|nr:prolyl oligopeptidase family serine peptidase [Bacteroidales bacterium]HSA42816.1 prolyl oligopeptidase family serine peptidase [Bacteroidales bacterium]